MTFWQAIGSLFAIVFAIIMAALVYGLSTIGNCSRPDPDMGLFTIEWLDLPDSSFAFRKNWKYDEFVSKDDEGHFHNNSGDVPDNMRDRNGNILKDSLAPFFKIVDTTHYFHTLYSETNHLPEFGDAFYASAEHLAGNDTTFCYTHDNISTHSSLYFALIGDLKQVKLVCNSIIAKENDKNNGHYVFTSDKFYLTIDPTAWKRDTLKACFTVYFQDTIYHKNPTEMSWTGKIYTPISRKRNPKAPFAYLPPYQQL